MASGKMTAQRAYKALESEINTERRMQGIRKGREGKYVQLSGHLGLQDLYQVPGDGLSFPVLVC
jgi:hypothetical protein